MMQREKLKRSKPQGESIDAPPVWKATRVREALYSSQFTLLCLLSKSDAVH